MKDHCRLLTELQTRNLSEEDCIAYLAKMRWPQGFVCACGSAQAWKTKRGTWSCKCCGTQTSVTSDTIFHGTHKSLVLWFRVMWYMTIQDDGISAKDIQQVFGLKSYETAWQWLHKLRKAMIPSPLNGVIQVNVNNIGGKTCMKTKESALVAIAVERKSQKDGGRIYLKIVPDTSLDSLTAFIRAAIAPDGIVSTDDQQVYDAFLKLGFRPLLLYTEDLLLSKIVAVRLEEWLKKIYRGTIDLKYLEYYLYEFSFRYNHENGRSRGILFRQLIQNAIKLAR